MRNHVSYGLDLSGYTTEKTSLCRASQDGSVINVEVFGSHPFNPKISSNSNLCELNWTQAKALDYVCKHANVYVDVPIDLQQLAPIAANIACEMRYHWQLTNRPVDKAFNALPALADRIGACVARFIAIIGCLPENSNVKCGYNLYETYPAASLEQMGLRSTGYKGAECIYQGREWHGCESEKRKRQSNLLANLANELQLTATEGTSLSDDDCDAIICALVGLAGKNERLEGVELEDVVRRSLRKKYPELGSFDPPVGYVILREKLSKEIRVVASTELVWK